MPTSTQWVYVSRNAVYDVLSRPLCHRGHSRLHTERSTLLVCDGNSDIRRKVVVLSKGGTDTIQQLLPLLHTTPRSSSFKFAALVTESTFDGIVCRYAEALWHFSNWKHAEILTVANGTTHHVLYVAKFHFAPGVLSPYYSRRTSDNIHVIVREPLLKSMQ